MNVKEYLDSIGLDKTEEFKDTFLEEELKLITVEAVSLTDEERKQLYTYPIPKISEDGSCTLPDQLEDEPYDVSRKFNDDRKMVFIKKIVELLKEQTASEWAGIYKKINDKLVKLYYIEAPSRPEFPLTEDFAKISNNSKVGMSGKAILVNDVEAHVEQGKAYYNCDNKVKSELCLPILVNGKVWGIIDLEAFNKKHYSDQRIFRAAMIAVYFSEKI